MTQTSNLAGLDRSVCPQCGTELAVSALDCPACHAIVNANQLKELAATATDLSTRGQHVEARDTWLQALALLPETSKQHTVITARVAELSRQIEAQEGGTSKPKVYGPWWKRGFAIGVTVLLLLVGKFKFLLLGLTKASTFLSMFAFFGVYWTAFGWPLALGLVVSIYIHEMGHVAMIRRLGMQTSAPLFIPGLGALVLLKQRIDDPLTDAKIGLAGPVWGLGAGLLSYGIYVATKTPIWLAIAQLTGFINLFNLIPIWQLDGARGVHALSSVHRFILIIVIAAVYLATQQKMLLLVGVVALWRAFQRTAVPGDLPTLLKFSALVASLSWLAMQR
jgi:Zn-dependent protease